MMAGLKMLHAAIIVLLYALAAPSSAAPPHVSHFYPMPDSTSGLCSSSNQSPLPHAGPSKHTRSQLDARGEDYQSEYHGARAMSVQPIPNSARHSLALAVEGQALFQEGAPIISYFELPPKLEGYIGAIVLNEQAHICKSALPTTVCCAQGPSIPAADISHFAVEYCRSWEENDPSFNASEVFMKRAAFNVSTIWVTNFGEARDLASSTCEDLTQILMSNCTTWDGHFTGGSVHSDNWQFYVKADASANDIVCDTAPPKDPDLDFLSMTQELCKSSVWDGNIGVLPVGQGKNGVSIQGVTYGANNATRAPLQPGECFKIFSNILERCGNHGGIYHEGITDFRVDLPHLG